MVVELSLTMTAIFFCWVLLLYLLRCLFIECSKSLFDLFVYFKMEDGREVTVFGIENQRRDVFERREKKKGNEEDNVIAEIK